MTADAWWLIGIFALVVLAGGMGAWWITQDDYRPAHTHRPRKPGRSIGLDDATVLVSRGVARPGRRSHRA